MASNASLWLMDDVSNGKAHAGDQRVVRPCRLRHGFPSLLRCPVSFLEKAGYDEEASSDPRRAEQKTPMSVSST